MAGEPVRSKFLNEWIASCPCRLAGVAAIHCLAVNIAQSMALGHSLHASNAWSCFGRAGSCARGALDGARSEDASTAPPRYNGPFCDSVSRRAEPACLFSPTDQRAGRDSCSASWHPVSVASLIPDTQNTHGLNLPAPRHRNFLVPDLGAEQLLCSPGVWRALHHCPAAAERDRQPAHGPWSQQLGDGCTDPLPPHAGSQHPV